jgi:hypothetical protein
MQDKKRRMIAETSNQLGFITSKLQQQFFLSAYSKCEMMDPLRSFLNQWNQN